MSLKSKVVSLGLAVAVLAATSASAFAYDAYTKGTVNVRSGPSTYYKVIDKLWGGEYVDVDYCKGSWCFVDYDGGDGWVSKKFLAQYDNDDYHPNGSYGAHFNGKGGGIYFELGY